ncbi:MAG: hypothetical protein U9N42_10095 [Campylobacterota bacterium]|nr:hypothetical protein [Campylobacterota bacterium]
MKKFLISLLLTVVVVVVVVVGGVYTMLFTPYGNEKVAPMIKEALDDELHVDSTIDKFLLNTDEFEIILHLSSDNMLSAKGTYSISEQSVNATYKVMFEKLADLKVVTKTDLIGALHVEGIAVGNQEELIVSGSSDIASSKTTYKAVLNNFNPSRIQATIKDASLSQLLSLVKQPHYSDGLLSVNADITDVNIGTLAGTVVTKISKGKLNAKLMQKDFGLKNMPATSYTLHVNSNLNGNDVVSAVDFNSNLASLNVKKAVFDVSNSYIKSDYKLNIASLNNLYFITERDLDGGIVITGDLSKDKDLRFSANSNTLGGNIKANLVNDDFKAKLNSLNTLSMLKMLKYPQMFNSTLNGDLKYNLKSQKGDLDAKLLNGQFVKNQMFDAIKNLASTDLYKYKYESTLKTDINKENLTTDLVMKSNNVLIESKKMKLNTKTNIIDASFDINANKNEIGVSLTGDVNSPKVDIDATKLIKKEGGKLLQKELNKHMDKDTANKIGNLLNGLF